MANPPEYKTPDNMRIYAIGDVHGHLDLLIKMHQVIFNDLDENPPGQARIITLGDYIDRGPDSRGVIEYLIHAHDNDNGIGRDILRGNHEDGMFEFLSNPLHEDWLHWGGIQTCESYGVSVDGDEALVMPDEKQRVAQAMINALPDDHVTFLKSRPTSIVHGDYLFAHAGVNPLIPLHEQTDKALTRMRQPFLNWHQADEYTPLPKKIVHGHSIEREPSNLPHRIGVDTCAFGRGVLSAAVLDGDDVRFLQVRG